MIGDLPICHLMAMTKETGRSASREQSFSLILAVCLSLEVDGWRRTEGSDGPRVVTMHLINEQDPTFNGHRSVGL